MPPKRKTSSLSGKLTRDVFFGTDPNLPKIIEIDLSKLRTNPSQPRTLIDEKLLDQLAATIEKHGLIQPIAVTNDPDEPGRFIIVAGERRFRAFQKLGKETIPAIQTSGATDEIALIENIQRENLHPLEEARALANLIEKHGYRQEDAAEVIGKSRPTVNELLRLISLPALIQEECRTFDIPKSTLVALSRMHSEEEQLSAWKEAKHGRMTVRTAKAVQKGHTNHQTVSHPLQKAVETGRGFVRRLERASKTQTLPDEATVRDLYALYDQIGEIIERFSNNETPG
jgi:ParB family chromosome partitioning protein